MSTATRAGDGLKQKLAQGRLVIAATTTFAHPGLAEFLGGLGFDGVVVNGEHGPLADREIEAIVAACDLAGCAAILRVDADAPTLERYANMGVTGFQIPKARSVAHVRSVVDAVKYAPLGRRGLGSSRALGYGMSHEPLPELMARANDRIAILPQIEDREGLAAAADIAAMPDVDAILIGALDISDDLGVPGQTSHPDVVAMVDQIIRITLEAGKPVGLGAYSQETALAAVSRGARFLLTADLRLLVAAAAPLLDLAHKETK